MSDLSRTTDELHFKIVEATLELNLVWKDEYPSPCSVFQMPAAALEALLVMLEFRGTGEYAYRRRGFISGYTTFVFLKRRGEATFVPAELPVIEDISVS